MEGPNELSDLSENGTVDEILALAQKYPDIKHQAHWLAFSKAEGSGDTERARKITELMDDPELRRTAIARLDMAQHWASMNAEKVAEVQREIGHVPRIGNRIWILMVPASQVAANDRQAALKLLNQASSLIGTMKVGKEQTEAEVRLAMMYCLTKSDRGLAMMELLMPKLNDLVTAAAKLDGYETHYLRDGEWNMTGEGSVGKLLTMLSQNAAHFSWCDFDRAVSLAAQFERPEYPLGAIETAQGFCMSTQAFSYDDLRRPSCTLKN